MESKAPPRPAGSPSPGSPRLSFAPQTSHAFKSQSSDSKKKKKKKIPVPVFTRFPRPVPPSNPRPQSGLRSGSSGRAGVLQPRFFPWTQLQPRLPGNPGELSRRRTSLAGETPSATCWTRAGRSPYTWGPGSGVRVPGLSHVLRGGVSYCCHPQPLPAQSSSPARSRAPRLRPPDLVAVENLSHPRPSRLPSRLRSTRERLEPGGAAEHVRLRSVRGFPQTPPLALPAPGCHGDACLPARAREGHAGQLSWLV